jgi:hypothetical protein
MATQIHIQVCIQLIGHQYAYIQVSSAPQKFHSSKDRNIYYNQSMYNYSPYTDTKICGLHDKIAPSILQCICQHDKVVLQSSMHLELQTELTYQ